MTGNQVKEISQQATGFGFWLMCVCSLIVAEQGYPQVKE